MIRIACVKTGCWFVDGDDLTGLTDPLVATTSIILSSNKIQNGDILEPLTQVCLENGR